MAGNQNSGGNRPTADQNNPMKVSGVGGNGQSGQAAMRYTGMPYGQGQALMQQQQAATMSKPMPAVTTASGSPTARGLRTLADIPQLTDPTQFPDQPVTAGANAGPGPGTEALQIPSNMTPDNSQFNRTIDSYYPVLSFINSRPSTSAETRQVLSLLMRGRGV